ncbi:hypothetical protein [Rhizobium leguminosarum]|uniref:hypothetical protein n=1 Tax=Rhizobium leguminosarum TaxID=384 RepID=UPI00102F61E2|nr:hypothetical protein [Rhizobium leguminosarum]NZD53518.1 hypothetical protein [Rhizobium leguminosarum]TAY98579.1 hypothetical protein ELH79_08885 [Rhizobium leguminosarum]TAZ09344.1 hypothetical protein ELH78_08885 [Rhizobium leguminosarum]
MPTYTVELNGETFDIDAPNDDAVRAAVRQLQGQQPSAAAAPQPLSTTPQPEKSTLEKVTGNINSFGQGIVDMVGMGYADEIGAGIDYAGSHVLPWRDAKTYDQALADTRGEQEQAYEEHPAANIAGKVTGALWGASRLAKAGLSPTANAIKAEAGLGRVTAASAKEGAILGAISGFGNGEDGAGNRLVNAGVGGGLGLGIGAVAPAAVAGLTQVVKSAAAPLIAPFAPDGYVRDALATALRRAGMTPEQVTTNMRAAAADGQDMFNVADAMGYTGERLMSTSARVPHDNRQPLAEALMARQVGQGERLANNLAEGFDTFDTAGRRVADRTAQRTAEANELYPAARANAGPVNVTPVLEEIDRTISPGVNQVVNPRDRIANDSIEGALTRVRSMLSDGNSQVTDFDTLFRAKLDLDDMIQRAEGQGAGNRAHYLSRVQGLVDQALADASDGYVGARDAFARASRRIDAVDAGSAASRISRRAQDTIPEFEAMSPGEQVDFRAGYIDPLIARLEGASSSPTTNKARMLQTPKFEAELPAFAAPERGGQLGDRIGREQTMFRTANAALGNSKTADNLADAADMNQFDPAVIGRLVRGDPIGAITTGLSKALGTLTGQPPSVVERLSRVLMETNPDVALDVLRAGTQQLSRNDQLRARLVSALVESGAAGVPRLTAP